jgi:hypothetical protein
MDDRIGRLDAKLGVDRTATGQAVRSVTHWPFDARSVRNAPNCVDDSAGTSRQARHAVDAAKLPQACVRLGGIITAATGPATARLRAADAATSKADHGLEQALTSAAGEFAGAILCRSQQI